MFRETILIIFTIALVGLTSFSTDAIRGLMAGDVEVVMSGFIASLVGIAIALAAAILAGRWLVRDDRRTKESEKERHKELLDAVKSFKDYKNDK